MIPVAFTWMHENFVTWNEGVGWHTQWKASHRSFVRLVDGKYVVVVWLPSDRDPARFLPDIAVIDRGNPRFLRYYPNLRVGEDRDGWLKLSSLKIERSAQLLAAKPMTQGEETMQSDVEARKYGYLYGMSFRQEQWERSADLVGLLSNRNGIVQLGKPTPQGQKIPAVWRAFYKFNSGVAMIEKMERHLFGFEFRDDSWVSLSNSGVYWYREGLKDETSPIWISYQGHRFDQQQHEMLFDTSRQHLVIFWRYSLASLRPVDN